MSLIIVSDMTTIEEEELSTVLWALQFCTDRVVNAVIDDKLDLPNDVKDQIEDAHRNVKLGSDTTKCRRKSRRNSSAAQRELVRGELQCSATFQRLLFEALSLKEEMEGNEFVQVKNI